MFKQIFNKSDGKPELVQSVSDEETGEEYFDYNESEYTTEMPPSDLYEPIYFEDGTWKGATKEEWEYEQGEQETDPHIPSANEMMLAQAQMQVTKTANQLVKSQKEQAETLKELTKKEKRMKQLEEQQAQTMLEIAKLKGE
ncbi:hypothetical protein P3T86_05825 [Staphylococcus nepalensis]|uniref:hypothetical protein n=1 Tax=Staphylococcus nepalensis TaxID=214473 RepID=UPI002B259B5E|nr:hypothetical protein [Staphylococcus nepalensis]WQL21277.1 hypothetical protein P3T86_05825 [Staphylococcus nepalensis]